MEKDGTEGKTLLGKTQGNPWANKSDSDSKGSNSRYSDRKGWFKETDNKSGYSGFQIKRKSGNTTQQLSSFD
jgi:hypothetical protein